MLNLYSVKKSTTRLFPTFRSYIPTLLFCSMPYKFISNCLTETIKKVSGKVCFGFSTGPLIFFCQGTITTTTKMYNLFNLISSVVLKLKQLNSTVLTTGIWSKMRTMASLSTSKQKVQLIDLIQHIITNFIENSFLPVGFPRISSTLSLRIWICLCSCLFSSTCISYLVFHSLP